MKNLFVFALVVFFTGIVQNGYSQVEEKESLMSLGNQNALVINVPTVNIKKAEGYFKSYFKDFGKVKWNKKAREYYINGAKVKAISKEKLNIYGKFQELDNGLLLYLFVDNGFAFVSSEGELNTEYQAVSDILEDFSEFVNKSLIEEELSDAEKNLARMERDLSQLEKEKEKYEKSIEDAQKRIAELEISIENNISEQENKTEEINIHRLGIDEIKERLRAVTKSSKK